MSGIGAVLGGGISGFGPMPAETGNRAAVPHPVANNAVIIRVYVRMSVRFRRKNHASAVLRRLRLPSTPHYAR